MVHWAEIRCRPMQGGSRRLAWVRTLGKSYKIMSDRIACKRGHWVRKGMSVVSPAYPLRRSSQYLHQYGQKKEGRILTAPLWANRSSEHSAL